jgi:hypothetical protein
MNQSSYTHKSTFKYSPSNQILHVLITALVLSLEQFYHIYVSLRLLELLDNNGSFEVNHYRCELCVSSDYRLFNFYFYHYHSIAYK